MHREQAMQFEERDQDGYRIRAEAIGGECGEGYVAAVVISRIPGAGSPQEAFRDEALAGGYRWPSSAAALRYAMGKGHALLVSGHSRPFP